MIGGGGGVLIVKLMRQVGALTIRISLSRKVKSVLGSATTTVSLAEIRCPRYYSTELTSV